MHPSTVKIRDTYAIKPGAPFVIREFGFYSFDQWKEDGSPHTWQEINALAQLEGLDGEYYLGALGWCEAQMYPSFPTTVLEDRGDHEVVQDNAGRKVLYFKGRRSGFMPEYIDHPVKDMATFKDNILWRLNPNETLRYEHIAQRMPDAEKADTEGKFITQNIIGGYMYLRSLIGPENLLYMFYDAPEVIHACMEAWFALADAITAKHQEHVSLDQIFMAEDICYNCGSLISPDMIQEFLFPYYKKYLNNCVKRQKSGKHIYYHVDTDGYCMDVLPLYKNTLGLEVMSPFEVASGCDVVEAGKIYPDIVISGGIDKRVLARGIKEIDEMLDYILPAMHKRGGYIPTCDHGVPAEVPFGNWLHYRKRCLEYI